MITTRRHLLTLASAGALASACSKAGGGRASAPGEDPSDMALGDPRAKAKLIEYASITCSHCADFHRNTWPKLKANYIDAGKVRFVFREFPTSPVEVAVAGFQIARCGGNSTERYFEIVGALFDQQDGVFEAIQSGQTREKLLEIAKASGVSDSQFSKCVSDPEGIKRIQATVNKGVDKFKISSTPTLVLNGEVIDQQYQSYDALSKLLDKTIAGS